MRAEQIIFESRGVTARDQGETYVSVSDPADILTIQEIIPIPQDVASFENLENLESALDALIPLDARRIDDNAKNSGTLAAVIAHVTDANNQSQYWIRYLKQIPPGGIHGLWKTLRGYKYGKGHKQESLPIKPSDLVSDENYRSTDQLANAILDNIHSQMAGTGHEDFAPIMEQAVEQARTGKSTYISNAHEYSGVLQKYGGEYLGPLALIDATSSVGGNTSEVLKHFGLTNLAGSTVMFPQDTGMELIDSVVRTSDGIDLQISSKISKAGGAASSLSGVYKQITDEQRNEFQTGVKIIEILATKSAVSGPVQVAFDLGIIDKNAVAALESLDRASRNIGDITDDKLRAMVQAQPVQPGTLERNDYRVFYHALTAIVNAMMPVVNQNADFKAAMLAALNNNQYIQLITKGSKQGQDLALSYYTKFPAVFAGSPQLVNKSYFATGQKGRIGFKLK